MNDGVEIIDIEIGKTKKINYGELAAWNPVEKNTIAIISGKSLRHIKLLDPLSLKEKASYISQGSIISVTWSPDGNYLAYAEHYFKGVRFVILDKQFKLIKIINNAGIFYITKNILWR